MSNQVMDFFKAVYGKLHGSEELRSTSTATMSRLTALRSSDQHQSLEALQAKADALRLRQSSVISGSAAKQSARISAVMHNHPACSSENWQSYNSKLGYTGGHDSAAR